MQKFCFAAEVMRYTPKSGWTEDDTKSFTGFLKVMLPSNDKPTAYMNQGSIGTMGYMSSGIFMDDMDIYAKAIARTTVGRESKVPNRDYSIKNQLREVVDSISGEKRIILVEMGRDQGHAQGDIGALGSLARSAYIQGTKVDSAGDIVRDNSGVNVFQFLNNRLLTAAGIVAKFNLGYDEIFYPRTATGTTERAEYFNNVSSALRGQLHPVYELIYNHYKYNEGVQDGDPYLKVVKQVIDFYTPEQGSEDFPGDGTLLFTTEAEAHKNKAPKGPPKKLTLPDYEAVTKHYGRIQAETFTGSKGNISTDLKRQNFGNGDVGYRPISDHEGTRRIISEIKEKFYVWYTNVDFGAVPVDKLVMRTASSIGCKVDVVLLDNISGINWNNVTEEDIAKGEKVATIQVPATGWWTYFTVFTATINKKLTGKHSFAFRFYGSGHVYTLQATMDWFKLVKRYGNEDNAATDADAFLSGATKAGEDGV
ncbi:MAG TPA: carbohydrate-binding protein, partial [Segetibacter sp.]